MNRIKMPWAITGDGATCCMAPGLPAGNSYRTAASGCDPDDAGDGRGYERVPRY